MVVAAGIIIGWPSTIASIPSNWSRVSELDSRHPKGTADAVEPDVTGGAVNHTHVSISHNHSLSSHNHVSTPTSGTVQNLQTVEGIDNTSIGVNHTHSLPDAISAGGVAAGAQASWQTESNDPPSFEVIWIESDGVPSGFPVGALVYTDTPTVPNGWTHHAGSKTRFLIGATVGQDAGGTFGSLTHVHIAGSHVHSVGHSHLGTSDAGSSSSDDDLAEGTLGSFSFDFPASRPHTHLAENVVFQSTGKNIGSTSSANSGNNTTDKQPPFHTLPIVENTGSGEDINVAMIALWLGALSSIPENWELCDGVGVAPDLRNRYIKGANVFGDRGTLGGGPTHNHPSPTSHVHAQGHQHNTIIQGTTTGNVLRTSAPATVAGRDHIHLGINSTAGSSGNSGTGVQDVPNNESVEPLFLTVAYIYFLGLPFTGAGPLTY